MLLACCICCFVIAIAICDYMIPFVIATVTIGIGTDVIDTIAIGTVAIWIINY